MRDFRNDPFGPVQNDIIRVSQNQKARVLQSFLPRSVVIGTLVVGFSVKFYDYLDRSAAKIDEGLIIKRHLPSKLVSTL